MRKPKVSVIIAVRSINENLKAHLPKILELNYPNLEILIHVNEKRPELSWPKTKIVFQPGVSAPPQKRNALARQAKGEILAFIDDDAYPNPNWLDQATPWFRDENIAGVGGPNLTHPKDNIWQRVSGWVWASRFGSGGSGISRVKEVTSARGKEIEDWPSVNLIVRKKDFDRVGGFVSRYYPGEDTKLCLDLVKKLGKKIVYEPEAVVFHHRRPIFTGHLKQVGTYGRHRGHFARIYPETSRKLGYFLPSIFTAGLVLGPIIGAIFPPLMLIYLLCLLTYLALLLHSAYETYRNSHRLLDSLLVIPAILTTHVWYGISFIKGLLAKDYAGRGNY